MVKKVLKTRTTQVAMEKFFLLSKTSLFCISASINTHIFKRTTSPYRNLRCVTVSSRPVPPVNVIRSRDEKERRDSAMHSIHRTDEFEFIKYIYAQFASSRLPVAV